jgi:acyl dehydratase
MKTPPRPTAEAMQFWCEIMRDDNAIHLDQAAAERAGFGARRVNPGPANLALVVNAWMAAHDGRTPARIEASFLGNVFEDDALEVRADGPDTLSLHRADAPDSPALTARFHSEITPE